MFQFFVFILILSFADLAWAGSEGNGIPCNHSRAQDPRLFDFWRGLSLELRQEILSYTDSDTQKAVGTASWDNFEDQGRADLYRTPEWWRDQILETYSSIILLRDSIASGPEWKGAIFELPEEALDLEDRLNQYLAQSRKLKLPQIYRYLRNYKVFLSQKIKQIKNAKKHYASARKALDHRRKKLMKNEAILDGEIFEATIEMLMFAPLIGVGLGFEAIAKILERQNPESQIYPMMRSGAKTSVASFAFGFGRQCFSYFKLSGKRFCNYLGQRLLVSQKSKMKVKSKSEIDDLKTEIAQNKSKRDVLENLEIKSNEQNQFWEDYLYWQEDPVMVSAFFYGGLIDRLKLTEE